MSLLLNSSVYIQLMLVLLSIICVPENPSFLRHQTDSSRSVFVFVLV